MTTNKLRAMTLAEIEKACREGQTVYFLTNEGDFEIRKYTPDPHVRIVKSDAVEGRYIFSVSTNLWFDLEGIDGLFSNYWIAWAFATRAKAQRNDPR